jgi:hypothetical protein
MFWAFIYAVTMATLLSIIAYILPRPENASQAVYRIADALVTGALGFFAGRVSSMLTSKDKTQPGDESQ